MDKQIQLLEIYEIKKQIMKLKPLGKSEIISLTLILLEKDGIEIIDNENEEWKLDNLSYDNVKDEIRFVTKARKEK